MNTPCWNCGSDLRVCINCDLYNGKYIEIPDNVTNGDVIIKTYKPYKICVHEYVVHIYMTENDFNRAEYQMSFDVDWWDAPYQKGGKKYNAK